MNAMRHTYPIKEAATLAVIQCTTDLGASVGTSHHGGATRNLGLQVERNIKPIKPRNQGAVPTHHEDFGISLATAHHAINAKDWYKEAAISQDQLA